MVSHVLHVSLNADAPMMVSSRPCGRKCDMVELLSDENSPPGDTGCIVNAKGTKLNSSGLWNPNDIPLQEIDDNDGIHKRHRNLPSQYQE